MGQPLGAGASPGTGDVGREEGWHGPCLRGAYALAPPTLQGHTVADKDFVQGWAVPFTGRISEGIQLKSWELPPETDTVHMSCWLHRGLSFRTIAVFRFCSLRPILAAGCRRVGDETESIPTHRVS